MSFSNLSQNAAYVGQYRTNRCRESDPMRKDAGTRLPCRQALR